MSSLSCILTCDLYPISRILLINLLPSIQTLAILKVVKLSLNPPDNVVGHDQDMEEEHRAHCSHLFPRLLGQSHLWPDDLAVHLILETLTHIKVQPWVIGDYAIDKGRPSTGGTPPTAQVLSDAPLHPARLVDGPGQEELVGALELAEEHAAWGSHEALLVEVEAEVGDAEEVVRVEKGGADMGQGESREVSAGCLEEGCLFLGVNQVV